MILTEEHLRGISPPVEARLVLQIHDELVWEVRDQDVYATAGKCRSPKDYLQFKGISVSYRTFNIHQSANLLTDVEPLIVGLRSGIRGISRSVSDLLCLELKLGLNALPGEKYLSIRLFVKGQSDVKVGNLNVECEFI